MNELVQEWVLKSDEDWRSAEVLLADSSPLVTPALFHLQQCAEKLLKALLVQKRISFERRHDLSYLHKLCDEPLIAPHSRLLLELTPFAVEFRYPGDLPQFSISEAEQLMGRVEIFRNKLRPLVVRK